MGYGFEGVAEGVAKIKYFACAFTIELIGGDDFGFPAHGFFYAFFQGRAIEGHKIFEIFASQLKKGASNVMPYFTTSPKPDTISRALKVFRKLGSQTTSAG